MIIIEHRKRNAIAKINEKENEKKKTASIKSNGTRKRRMENLTTISNDNSIKPSDSASNGQLKSLGDSIEPNGKYDSLSRQQSSPNVLTTSLPPPVPPPRPLLPHSKSLNAVTLSSHKVCTEV